MQRMTDSELEEFFLDYNNFGLFNAKLPSYYEFFSKLENLEVQYIEVI